MKLQSVKMSVGQTTQVLAALYVLMSLPFLVVGSLFGAFHGGAGVIILVGVVAPLIYGTLTYLCTGLVMWLYKLVADRSGGMECKVKEISDTTKA